VPYFDRVIGVDAIEPPRTFPGEFVRADIRNPILSRVMASGVDTVIHMGVISTPRQAGGRMEMKDINVIGTMQLLAACQRTASVRSLVVKSTSMVYGSGPKDPAMFTEDTEPRHQPASGWAKDSVEVEAYVRGFGRRRPDVRIVTLRFANIIGPGMRTGMTAYFRLPVVPTVAGFDPRLQFTHEDDSLAAVRVAALSEHAGTFNIAGDGVITVTQAIRHMGKVPVPTPRLALDALRQVGTIGADFSAEQIRFLTYGRVLDTSAARDTLGFTCEYSTVQAFDEFAHRAQGG
jgi:UDP-glucose 4-epimerase